MSGMWQSIVTNYQADLVTALESGDAGQLSLVLESGGKFTYGIGDQGDIEWDRKLLPLLAQQVGVCRAFNPESPRPLAENNLKPEIEKKTGIRFELPSCFHFSNATGLPNRFFYSHSAAYTMLLRLGRPPRSVLEIGAGLGFMGHICWQWKCPYTVIDLPTVAVMSAYFLSKACGEDEIWLYGEEDQPKPFARFYPCTHFEQPEGSCHVAYNNDSLAEMTEGMIRAYARFISKSLSEDGFFLSINHESNSNTVSECAEGLKLCSRSAWMMRPGYMEEVYSKQQSD